MACDRALRRNTDTDGTAVASRTLPSSAFMGSSGDRGGAASGGADERTQLMPGRAGERRGDLESIFARLEAQPVRPQCRCVGDSSARASVMRLRMVRVLAMRACRETGWLGAHGVGGTRGRRPAR